MITKSPKGVVTKISHIGKKQGSLKLIDPPLESAFPLEGSPGEQNPH